MACSPQTLAGLARDCTPSQGGIVEVYLANYEQVESVEAASGKITAINMVDGAKFKRYSFHRNTGSLTSTYTIDAVNRIQYVTSNLVLLFNRMETAKRIEMQALAVNDLVAIVKDANGVFTYLGKDEPVHSSTLDFQTGTARTDANRYSVTLQDISQELPFEVDAAAIPTIID